MAARGDVRTQGQLGVRVSHGKHDFNISNITHSLRHSHQRRHAIPMRMPRDRDVFTSDRAPCLSVRPERSGAGSGMAWHGRERTLEMMTRRASSALAPNIAAAATQRARLGEALSRTILEQMNAKISPPKTDTRRKTQRHAARWNRQMKPSRHPSARIGRSVSQPGRNSPPRAEPPAPSEENGAAPAKWQTVDRWGRPEPETVGDRDDVWGSADLQDEADLKGMAWVFAGRDCLF